MLLSICTVLVRLQLPLIAQQSENQQSSVSKLEDNVVKNNNVRDNHINKFDSYVLHVHHAATPITIDGKMTEGEWQQAKPISDFIQHFPTDSLMAQSRVEVRAMADDRFLYFAFTCYDSTSGNFLVQSLRRDADPGDGNDMIGVILDPMGTKINGFSFFVSPLGVQRESFIANGGMFGGDPSWDNVWHCEAHVHNDRWTAEVAIPFNSIRFESGRKQWRINFTRFDWKRNEVSAWTQFPINFRVTSLAHTGILEWDTPPQSAGVNLSIIPYAVGIVNHNYAADNTTKLNGGAGVDVKYALTSALNLDVTVNPDFSNVTPDRQITNLDRFSIFFPERRQFFIENSDLFAGFGFSQIRPFFSRKIGLARDSTGNLNNVAIPIGARVTGNLDENWRVGLMSMQTAANGAMGLETQNYTVAAAQYRVLGRSSIAGIFVNRQGNNYETQGNHFNRVLGLDFNYASPDGSMLGKVFYHHSFTPNPQPEQFATAGWLQYNQPNFEVNWNHEYIGTNYKPEVGFLRRTQVFRLQPIVTVRLFPQDRTVVTQHGAGTDFDGYWNNHSWQMLDRSWFGWYYVTFANTAEVSAFVGEIYTYLYSAWDPTGLNRTPLPVNGYQYYRYGIEFNTDRRALFNFSGRVASGSYFNGQRLNIVGNLTWRMQPLGGLRLSVQQDNLDMPAPYASAYFTLVGTELEFTPTRELFFNAFVQYNTQAANMNVNMRLQWRFAPMSDVFLVYTDNYGITPFDDRTSAEARWIPDIRVRNRAIALKFTYWFNA
jgi:hypothetical protein